MDDKALIPISEVCARLGGVSRMTIHNWRHDPDLKFPPPVKFKRRVFWRPADIDRWTETRIQRTA